MSVEKCVCCGKPLDENHLAGAAHFARHEDGECLCPKPEYVPCALCGTETLYTNTRRCTNCWEVEHRLDLFMADPRAILLIKDKMKLMELKKNASLATEIVDNEDELEEYSDKLQAAKDSVIEGHIADVTNWVNKESDSFELGIFLKGVLGLDKMTLSQIKDSFGSYLTDEDESDKSRDSRELKEAFEKLERAEKRYGEMFGPLPSIIERGVLNPKAVLKRELDSSKE